MLPITAVAPILQGVLGGGQLLGGLFTSMFSKRPNEDLLKKNISDAEQAAANSRARAYQGQNRALYGYSPNEMASMLRAQRNAANVGMANLRSNAGSRGQYLANLGAQAQQGAAGTADVYAKSEGVKNQKQQYADTLGSQADQALMAIGERRQYLDAIRRQIDMQKRQAASGMIGAGISQIGNVGKLLMQQDANQKYYDYINKGLAARGFQPYPNGYMEPILSDRAQSMGELDNLINGDMSAGAMSAAPNYEGAPNINAGGYYDSSSYANSPLAPNFNLLGGGEGGDYSQPYTGESTDYNTATGGGLYKRGGLVKPRRKWSLKADGGMVTGDEDDDEETTDAMKVVERAQKTVKKVQDMNGTDDEEEVETTDVEETEEPEMEEEAPEMKAGGAVKMVKTGLEKYSQSRVRLRGKKYKKGKDSFKIKMPAEEREVAAKLKAEGGTLNAPKSKRNPKELEDTEYDLSMFEDSKDAENFAKRNKLDEYLHGGKIHKTKKK